MGGEVPLKFFISPSTTPIDWSYINWTTNPQSSLMTINTSPILRHVLCIINNAHRIEIQHIRLGFTVSSTTPYGKHHKCFAPNHWTFETKGEHNSSTSPHTFAYKSTLVTIIKSQDLIHMYLYLGQTPTWATHNSTPW
jgi:hypothetical protein